MATYTVTASLVQGAQTPITVVTFNPAPLLTATQPGSVSTYYTNGQTVTDVQIDATTVTKHQGKGAIK